ncbi:MAG: TolC family protein [Bacteroidaceae bacterium]|nr:TolC family protein [Bacteroidaceae bacterium]
MKHLPKYIASLLLALGATAASAQSNDSIFTSLHSETLQVTQDMQTATLGECLEKGLNKNYSLRIIRNKEQIAANNATMENAGMLPSVSLSAGYKGSAYGRNTTATGGTITKDRGIYDDGIDAGVDVSWTLFDGFKTVANYDRLRELSLLSSTQTRLAVEDYMASLAAEYYNFVQQRQRLQNYVSAVELSRERLRIVYERWMIGSLSRLDLLQARVDFNADSAQCLKQREALASSRIRLHELMAEDSLNVNFAPIDHDIDLLVLPQFDSLWVQTKDNNASMLMAAQNRTLAEIDLRSVRSRNYPYLKLAAGYGYSTNHYGAGATLKRNQWGGDVGLTLGFNLYDGKRRSEQRNARLSVKNAELEEYDLTLSLYTDLADLWQAYENNRMLLALERENVLAARENYSIAHERYLLGDLSGIEMREAQKSLLDAEERILVAEYNTKLCEISLLQLSGGIGVYLE